MKSLNSTINVKTSEREELVDITQEVSSFVSGSGTSSGVLYVYIPHTTAAVTINENADPDVKSDIVKGLSLIVPEDAPYDHAEGNSPAHIKSSLVGSSASVFIEGERLLLGTWQGIYFCEFDGPRTRKVHMKIIER